MSSSGWISKAIGYDSTYLLEFASHEHRLYEFAKSNGKSRDDVRDAMIDVWKQKTMPIQESKWNLRPNHTHIEEVDINDLVNQVEKILLRKPFNRLAFGTALPSMRVTRDYRRD